MKKIFMGFIGAMMILSLAACTPTTEKNKGQEVKQSSEVKQEASSPKETKAPVDRSKLANSVDYERGNDLDAADESIVMIYTVDGDQLEGNMDSVETEIMEFDGAQALVDLLVKYAVLEEGTEVLEYYEEGDVAEAGPAGPGSEESSTASEKAFLNLSKMPEDGKNEKIVQAVAKTFMESMNVEMITIKIDGNTVAEDLADMDI